MRGFAYHRARDLDDALAQMPRVGADEPVCTATGQRWVAGGTNLLDLMKEDVQRPVHLVDIGGLPLDAITPSEHGGLLLGATARNADTAYHPLVRSRYPLLSAAILAGASPQIRQMATNAGNLLQRTRCYYFYDVGVPCNKRTPGTGCPARHGLARQLAILGTSEHCIATHPSDMCVALAALDATVHVRSLRGTRAIAFRDFHRLPGDRPDIDTTLAQDELVTHIELPADDLAAHSCYLKLRDRASYAFALVSVAAAFARDGAGRLRNVRVALGGVAPKPWRDAAAEALLEGQAPSATAFGQCADRLLAGARAWGCGPGPGHNGFKIPMAREAIVRALTLASEGIVTQTGEGAWARGGA